MEILLTILAAFMMGMGIRGLWATMSSSQPMNEAILSLILFGMGSVIYFGILRPL